MNRQQQRELAKQYQKKGIEKNLAVMVSKIRRQIDTSKSYKEGTKVKLNFDTLTTGNTKRLKWCETNKDCIFTVEYDEKYKNVKEPKIVCLKEDLNNPKWLFATYELTEIKS